MNSSLAEDYKIMYTVEIFPTNLKKKGYKTLEQEEGLFDILIEHLSLQHLQNQLAER
jgi:hypothetical protein